jgi:hypothetical protein
MAYTGYKEPSYSIRISGEPLRVDYKVETATNCYPGRFVARGTNDDDIVVADITKKVIGILSYETTTGGDKPTTISTAYGAGDWATVYTGSNAVVLSSLGAGFKAEKGDGLTVWSAGQVAPLFGEEWIKIPFSKNTSEEDTSVDLPSGVVVEDIAVYVTDEVASGELDVGLLSTEASGDADGFLDGISCATAGFIRPTATVTSGSSEEYLSATDYGVLLADFEAGADSAGDVGTFNRLYHTCDGTTVSVTYTTTNHDIAGYILLKVKHQGFGKVAVAEETVDASSGADDIIARMVM